MRLILRTRAVVLGCGLACLAGASDVGSAPDEEFAAVAKMLALSRTSLRQFCWNTRTAIRINGQVNRSREEICRSGPDGTVYRTPIGAPIPRNDVRGFRKRLVEVKPDPFEESMDAAVELTNRYLSLLPEKLQALLPAANALFIRRPGSSLIQLEFRNYLKAGDLLVFSFDPATRSPRMIDVTSYLADKTDIVTLRGVFESLPDGTSYVASSVLNAEGGHLQVVTENSNHRRVWP